MADLIYPSDTEVQLRLGTQEGAILDVVRRCSWWTKAEVEGRLPGSASVSGVTLTTTRAMESTLRRILQLSFGLVFPVEGGVGQKPVRETPVIEGRKSRSLR